MFRWLGLIDTWAPLVAPALIGLSPFYVLLFYWSFRRLPRELLEAARLEGMQPFAMWRRVGMPLVRPVTIAVALLAFIASWGNFLEPLVYLFDPDLYTLPLGLRSLETLDRTNYPMLLAGAVVATAPVVLAFVIAQRYFLHEDRGAGGSGDEPDRARRVRKRFGGTTALDGVDLEARDGELLVVVGPSGCGKSTLLRCVAGLEAVDEGTITIGERDVTR